MARKLWLLDLSRCNLSKVHAPDVGWMSLVPLLFLLAVLPPDIADACSIPRPSLRDLSITRSPVSVQALSTRELLLARSNFKHSGKLERTAAHKKAEGRGGVSRVVPAAPRRGPAPVPEPAAPLLFSVGCAVVIRVLRREARES